MNANKRTKRAARELFRQCLVDGVVDATRIREAGAGLAASRRRGALGILSSFARLVRLDRDRHTAIVESAEPLSASLRQQLEADLARVYGSTVATAFVDQPALIGGVRITVGSDVYDGSIRRRLEALAERL